ncbi:hypothetical protein P9112_006047 [Eukaryota sp. TZLM1-RC]
MEYTHPQDCDNFSHVSRVPSCSPSERHAQACSNPAIDFLPDAPHIRKSDISTSQNTSARTLPDVSHVPYPTTNETSFHNEELPADLTPNLYGQGGCRPQHASSNSRIGDTSAMAHLPDRSDKIGVKFISVGNNHTLLLTHSGEVYGWGQNGHGKALHKGPNEIKSPVRLPLTNVVTISASNARFLAFCSDGKLYLWPSSDYVLGEVNISKVESPRFSLLASSSNFKEVYCSQYVSFGLTEEGNVIKFDSNNAFKPIEGFSNIVFLCVCFYSVVAVDENGDFFWYNERCGNYHPGGSSADSASKTIKIGVTKYLSPKTPFHGSFFFDGECLFIVDINGEVWQSNKGDDDVPFNTKPTKVPGLSNIVFISGYNDVCAAIDKNGKVFVWGCVSRVSYFYEDTIVPRCVEAFTNIEGVSVGDDFLFAYNKNTVWAWGRNDKGQLGTGDLIDRPQPVKVFGSEILGAFHYSKRPLDRMFSGLIKSIYFEYLNYLKNLFGDHPYTKARLYTKCSISKKVAKFAKEVINGFEFLKNPQDLNLNDEICDLQLRLSTDYKGPKVVNTRIKKLFVYYNKVPHDPQLLTFFPNVEVVELVRKSISGRTTLNLTYLSNLQCLELKGAFYLEQLPTSLVKLVLNHYDIGVTDLSYLTSLQELILVSPFEINQGTLPTSLVKLMLKDPSIQVTDLSYLESLQELVMVCPFEIAQGTLPTSLVKLALEDDFIQVTDLSYLESLKELVVTCNSISSQILEGQIPLSQSIVRLENSLFPFTKPPNVEIQLLNVNELIIRLHVPTNITEQNFPSLKFVHLINPDEDSLSDSTLSPTKLISQGLIKSVKLIKNECLVELASFPWCIQYSYDESQCIRNIRKLFLRDGNK